MNFNFELALSLVNSTEQFPVDFDDAWQWLEYSTKSDAKVSFKKCGFLRDIDFISFQELDGKPQGGRPREIIKLTNDCFKVWAMMAGTAKGKEVRLYFLASSAWDESPSKFVAQIRNLCYPVSRLKLKFT